MDTSDEEEFNDKLIPYGVCNVFISFYCYNKGCHGHKISTEYNENTEKRRINDFLDQVSKSNPNLSNIRIKSGINPDLIRAILQHFLQQRRGREEGSIGSDDYDEGDENNDGTVKTITLYNCEISTFYDMNYISVSRNSDRTIELTDCGIFNDNDSNNKRDKIHQAIENCSYFKTWKIKGYTNKDLIFFLSALTRNKYIKHLKITFSNYRQLEEIMIINSITNLVVNNKNLSSLKLDFDYIPVNFTSDDAITGLANALINSKNIYELSFKSFCLRDIERKMLRLLMKCRQFRKLKIDHYKTILDTTDDDNHLKIKFNESTNLLLNDISTSCSDLVEIDITEIIRGELATTILLHFVLHNKSIKYVVLGLGVLAEIFQDHNFIEAVNNDKSNISPEISFKLNFGREERIINSNNRAIIGNTIEKVCFFSSWLIYARDEHVVEDMTFVLNALSRNKYLQSLHIKHDDFIDETQFNSCIGSITNVVNQSKTLSKLALQYIQYELSTTVTAALTGLAEALINSDTISDLSLHIRYYPEDWVDCITNFVTHTKKLSKLVLDLRNLETTTTASISNLAEALINSETIKDLSLYGFELKSMEAFQSIHSIFERKINLQRLSLDSSLFSWEEWIEDEDEMHYKIHWFKASIFSNLLQNRINSNLQILELECYIDNAELSQEMLLFLALLKDSNLEKLSFTTGSTGYSSEYRYASSVYRCLFVDVIPFMSRLHDFKFSTNDHELCENLREAYIKAVAICNRTLIKADFKYNAWDYGHETSISNQMFVESIGRYLQRNNALAACIENKTHLTKSAYPKVLVTSKPTGPDAAFQLLRNLGSLVGPKENTLSVKPKPALSYTITTKTPTCQSNKRKCTML